MGDRFRRAVSTLGAWSDADRVSLPYLLRFTELSEDARLDPVKEKYHELPDCYKNGRYRGLSIDPDLKDFQRLWPLKYYDKFDTRMTLRDLTHSSILYSLRNMLVHEQRDGVLGWDVSGNATMPFYGQLISNNGVAVQLVFPISFVIGLCADVSAGAKSLLISEQRNPFANFSAGYFAYPQFDFPDEDQRQDTSHRDAPC